MHPLENSQERVLVTGLGLITPLGIGTRASWQALCAGRSGITPINCFETLGMRTKIAGQVRGFAIQDLADPRLERRFDRFINFALATCRLAIEDAGLEMDSSQALNTAIFMGNALGGVASIENEARALCADQNKRVSPFFVPGILGNMAAAVPAIHFGVKGPNSSVNSACASGAEAIGLGYRAIQNREAEIAIVGGSEAGICPLMFKAYSSMKVTSRCNDRPDQASRPFELDRDGFVPAEGAGVLVLESLAAATRRRAEVYAEVLGYGSSCDAYHITSPEPSAESPARCIQNALADAGISPREVDCINAHGTSTKVNDLCETRAIQRVFGSYAQKLPITANKSMTGHMVGASGAVESAFSTLSIVDKVIPPTINYQTPDPSCALDYVPNQARDQEVTTVLSNSFGFGGANVSLVFKQALGLGGLSPRPSQG